MRSDAACEMMLCEGEHHHQRHAAEQHSAARNVNSASISNCPHGVRERIETNDSTALARNARLPSPSSLSNDQCSVPSGASLPILSTVTQTPSMVADVGRICRETSWVRSICLFPFHEVETV